MVYCKNHPSAWAAFLVAAGEWCSDSLLFGHGHIIIILIKGVWHGHIFVSQAGWSR